MRPTGGRLVHRGGRLWELTAVFGKVDGRYPTRTRRFEGTERQAEAALAAFVDELSAERPPAPVFRDFAGVWHDGRARARSVAPRTLEREISRLKALCLHLGDMRVDDIAPADIERAYAALMDGESLTGARLSPSTIASYHITLCGLFSQAVRDGIVDKSPCKSVRLPIVTPYEADPPTTAEVDALVASLDLTLPAHRGVALCALCGLRRSEAVAVSSRDFDGRRLTVRGSSAEDGTLAATKNRESRAVPVPEPLRSALANVDGRFCAMLPLSLSRWWQRNRDALGMPKVRLHDLRHAYVTRLAEAGVHPRVMMRLAGHRSIDVCMEVYTHVRDTALDDAVDAAFPAENSRCFRGALSESADKGAAGGDGTPPPTCGNSGAPDTIRTYDTRFRRATVECVTCDNVVISFAVPPI